MQQGTTITSEGMKCYDVLYVVLLHDNLHPHTTAHASALLELFNWELFDHAPYSPDLAQNYHLSTYLKNWL
jgi:transposase